ncbi:acyl-CoA dehydrogenase [Mycobacterium paraintracellulare]|uniref:acyl-CoA dehydrogenase family protein n=1 Tax=Mycobacterium paraintracellulare TaxID=1138383 RepID=UPI001927A510|nr:acyl-CoA dehydrogenase family protein [Mycobacterium paraintracellulare]BCO39202.1 acyl-CoA dehydrogenase [Mycobacterium paraintracellulare]
MSWDFTTDPEFQAKLDWADRFVREDVEPLDLVLPGRRFDIPSARVRSVIEPLKQRVRDEGLWAAHLGPELGGKGFGQLKLALLNEILGRSEWAPVIFGTMAPDTGNAEILAHYGTDAQKATYLQPLLDGEIFSCFSMTEPHGGSDPTQLVTSAVRDGEGWVLNGEKFFSSNAKTSAFLIVMAVTDPDVPAYQGMSMFLVPTGTLGVNILRNVGHSGTPMNSGIHGWIRYEDVRLPGDSILGGPGQAFVIAQTRLGGGRIHHAMRTIARCTQAMDMMCERVLSRSTKGTLLAEKQLVQAAIADSWIQIQQFRLLVLHTAWLIDQNTTAGARREVAACKVLCEHVLHDVAWRAMHIHGALGITNEMPLMPMIQEAATMGLADGPTEIHKVTVARQVLRDYAPHDGPFPSTWLPPRITAARDRYADLLGPEMVDL